MSQALIGLPTQEIPPVPYMFLETISSDLGKTPNNSKSGVGMARFIIFTDRKEHLRREKDSSKSELKDTYIIQAHHRHMR